MIRKAEKIFLIIIKSTFSSSRVIPLSLGVLCSPGIGQEYYRGKLVFNTKTLFTVSRKAS